LRLAEIYQKQDEVDASLKKFLKVADVYHVRDNTRRVEEIYHKILNLAPMDVVVRKKLIELYEERGEFDDALAQYQILADAHYQLAQINKALTTYQTALDLVDRAQNPLKWQVRLLHRIADIYMQRVDWLNAKNIYEKIVRLVPDDTQAAQYLIDLYFKLNQKSHAQAMLHRVAAIFAEQGQPEKMIHFLKALVQLRPRENSLRQQLAARYEQAGMRAEAIEQYDMLGELQLEAGLRDDAVKTIKKILSLNPDDPDGYNQLLSKIMQGI
jgi:tetratricopeptide (TPR) repeat protein